MPPPPPPLGNHPLPAGPPGGPRLGISQQTENFLGQGIRPRGKVAAVDNGLYFGKPAMRMGMIMAMAAPVTMVVDMGALARSVKVVHIMIVILMGGIQPHVEIAYREPGLFHPGYFHLVALQRKTGQRIRQYLLVGPQIQQRRHYHVAASARLALEIESFAHCRPF